MQFCLVAWCLVGVLGSTQHHQIHPHDHSNPCHNEEGALYPPVGTVVTHRTTDKQRTNIRQQRMAHGHDWPSPSNSDLLRAVRGEATSHVPVWLMRQAGRYLPEFQAVRQHVSFVELCQDPLLAAEVTVQPLRRFPALDAVIIFSDILVVPVAMGLNLKADPSPVFSGPLTPGDLSTLDLQPDVDRGLGYVFDAIFATKQRLRGAVPVIGFCGGPLTVFAYVVEGRGSHKWLHAKRWLYEKPQESHRLLAAIAAVSVSYLVGQADSGAQLLQVFDSNAGAFSGEVYAEFGMPYLLDLAERVKTQRPSVLMTAFPKDRADVRLANSSYDAVGLSWTEEPRKMRELFGSGVTLQGNLDPHVMYMSHDVIRRETRDMVKKFGQLRYIANLGHGMEPNMTVENVEVFLSSVRAASDELRSADVLT